MKILGNIPGKAKSFAVLLQELSRKSERERCLLLKTSQASRFFTNDTLFTKMIRAEWEELERIHWDSLVTDSEYKKAGQYRLSKILPKYLSKVVEEAKYIGGDETHNLVMLKGGEQEVVVEAEPFLTMAARHPKADWRFSTGRRYWKRPVVLVEPFGLLDGELVGLVPVVQIKLRETPKAPKIRKLFRVGRNWKYLNKEMINARTSESGSVSAGA